MSYFMLVERGADTKPGDVLQSELAAKEPRQVPVESDLYAPDLVLDRTQARLVRVAPRGRVQEYDSGGPFEATQGWEVEAFEPFAGLLGPQAAHLTTAVTMAEEHLHGMWEDDASPAGRYYTSVEAWYDTSVSASSRAKPHSEAARDALTAAGADGWWWWNRAFGDTYGEEMLALAARDLLGTTPQWDQAAYDMLTGPWRAAFGPIHPKDRPSGS
jgi:hypothetical protein